MTVAFVLVYFLPIGKLSRALFYSTFAIVSTIPFVMIGGPNLLVRHYQLYLALAIITLYFDDKLYIRFAVIMNLVYIAYCVFAPENFLMNDHINVGYMISLAIYLNTSTFILYMCTKWGNQLIHTAFEKNEEVKRYSEGLESVVEERTQDLNRANSHLKETNEALKSSIQQLQASQAQLILSEKLLSLGHLASGVATELSGPIDTASIATNAMYTEFQQLWEALQKGVLTKQHYIASIAEVKVTLRGLSENMLRSSDIVSQFKSIQNISNELYTTDLPLKDCLDIVWKNIEMDWDISRIQLISNLEDDFMVSGEPSDWIIVINNIVVNAVEHGIGNGPGWIQVNALRRDGYRQIEFSDSGPGIHESLRAYVFEPFFTSARDKGHIGLGLHIVNNIVARKFEGEIQIDQHGNSTIIRISIEDKSGVGENYVPSHPALNV